jgi:hypothetical protein
MMSPGIRARFTGGRRANNKTDNAPTTEGSPDSSGLPLAVAR